MNIISLNKETNEIQRVLTLQTNRNRRHRYREFVIEGRLAVEEAAKTGWKIRSIFYSKERSLPIWAEQYIAQGKYDTAYALTNQLMEKISDKTESAEIVAIIEQPLRSFASYQPKLRDVVVVLDEPNNPGNLGMMIRSSVAFGAAAIIISGHGADEFDPLCIRASRGTFFSASIYRAEGIKAFIRELETWRKNFNIRVIATGNQGSVPLEQAQLNADILFLVLGNETNGLSMGYQQLADEFVQIPLEGKFSSLNIAAAGSIFLYEIFRQRNMRCY
jgi:23S rRNA (uridine2479-2'-O)-methyltransferase